MNDDNPIHEWNCERCGMANSSPDARCEGCEETLEVLILALRASPSATDGWDTRMAANAGPKRVLCQIADVLQRLIQHQTEITD